MFVLTKLARLAPLGTLVIATARQAKISFIDSRPIPGSQRGDGYEQLSNQRRRSDTRKSTKPLKETD
jgi:hypothetical protein